MKKLLVLLLVFGMASVANAGLLLTVNGSPAPDVITLTVSEVITLDVSVEDGTLLAGGDLQIALSNPQGTLDDSGAFFETNPLTRQYITFMGTGWYNDPLAWDAQWNIDDKSAQHVSMTGGNLPDTGGNTLGPYTLLDGLVFHCEEETDVIIDLIALGDVVYYSFSGDPPVFDDMIRLYNKDDIIDSILVVQIPEPMTILLLGLGGLFLRRRK